MPAMSASPLSPFIAKMVILAASIVMIAIRAPHGQRSRGIKVVKHRKGRLEVALLALAMLGFFVPFIWMASPVFSFADYPLRPIPLALGIALLAAGLWLFHRSHVDLGTNWSVTLEVRESHRLVTHGVYRRVRHPMYAALLVYSVGQALALPNWLAGLSYLVPFTLLLASRLRAEERMMLEEFGDEYAAYMRTTKRLVPGVW
jgi:protein-S-isoprenylcysteine O-methyltransferase Ste14